MLHSNSRCLSLMPSTCGSIPRIDWVASAVEAQPILSIFYLLSDWPFCLPSISGKIPNVPPTECSKPVWQLVNVWRNDGSYHMSTQRRFRSSQGHLRFVLPPLWPLHLLASKKVLFHHSISPIKSQSEKPCVLTSPCTQPCNHLQ